MCRAPTRPSTRSPFESSVMGHGIDRSPTLSAGLPSTPSRLTSHPRAETIHPLDLRSQGHTAVALSPQVLDTLASQAIELPSWAFGNAGTRFKVFGTPGTPRTVQEKLADAAQVHALTGLAPTVSLHIPWDLVDDFAELADYAQGLACGCFSAHHAPLTVGTVRCCSQPCQKHPSTKTATLARVKAISMVRRGRPGTGYPTRYRSPAACRARRNTSSGPVSRRGCLLMRADTAAELACGPAIRRAQVPRLGRPEPGRAMQPPWPAAAARRCRSAARSGSSSRRTRTSRGRTAAVRLPGG